MSWIQTPIPGPDKRSRLQRLKDRMRPAPDVQGNVQPQGPAWWVISGVSAIIIAVSVWLITVDVLGWLGLDLPYAAVGIASGLGVLWFFAVLFKNPNTIVRRVFLSSAALTIFALTLTFGGPPLLNLLFGFTISAQVHWGVLITLGVINLMLFVAYLRTQRP